MPLAHQMYWKGKDQTISTSAVAIFTGGICASISTPQSVCVQNRSSYVVTVGGSDVGAGTKGIDIAANAVMIFSVHDSLEILYAISTNSGTVLSVLANNNHLTETI